MSSLLYLDQYTYLSPRSRKTELVTRILSVDPLRIVSLHEEFTDLNISHHAFIHTNDQPLDDRTLHEIRVDPHHYPTLVTDHHLVRMDELDLPIVRWTCILRISADHRYPYRADFCRPLIKRATDERDRVLSRVNT